MTPEPSIPATFACVDLGSNSFHWVAAREVEGRPVPVERLRERVALAEGLEEDGSLDPTVAARALTCLAGYGERAEGLASDRVRAVGTAAFRNIRDGQRFLEAAQVALGHPIEILSGTEEARLIFLGVAHTLGGGTGRRLVVDIGGGSTECVLGGGLESDTELSLPMGCVTWSRRFFPEGELSPAAFGRAEHEAARLVEAARARIEGGGWEHAVGSSGTILAAAKVLQDEGWSDGSITREGLERLRAAAIDRGHADRLAFAGLREDRRGVLPAGIAILRAVFDTLRLERMTTSKGSLREGLLVDLLDRIRDEGGGTRAKERPRG